MAWIGYVALGWLGASLLLGLLIGRIIALGSRRRSGTAGVAQMQPAAGSAAEPAWLPLQGVTIRQP